MSNEADFIVAAVGIFLLAILSHGFASLHLDAYYASHLPHYDSMGSYTKMYEIINARRAGDLHMAFELAANYDLSWLQGFFAFFLAGILEKSPASLQLYNSLCLLFAMLAIFEAARTLGLSPAKCFASALLVYIPDTFYEVQGGLADLQRDPSYVLLLAAAVFTWIGFVCSPSLLRSVVVGLSCGLTTLSRSSALPLQALLFGPLVAWYCLNALRDRKFAQSIRFLLSALLAFAALAGPFLYFRFISQMDRYRNSYVAYAIGDDAAASLRAHFAKPIEIVVGQIIAPNSFQKAGALISGYALGTAALILLIAAILGLLRFDFRNAWRIPGNRYLLLCSVWICAANFILICFVAKLRDLSYTETKYPFYPSLVAFFAVGVFLIQTVFLGRRVSRFGNVAKLTILLTALGAIGIIGALRTRAKVLPGNAEEIALVRRLAERFQPSGSKQLRVAVLWQQGVNVDALKYYASQVGTRRFTKLLYQFGGQWQDFDVRAPKGVDPALMMDAALGAISEQADLVLLNEDLEVYRNKNTNNPLFAAGVPLVEHVRRDTAFTRDFEFNFQGSRFLLLRRK